MAKTKLGNVRGPKGDKGDRGSLWRVTDKMTGRSTSDTAFPGANIEDSAVGDMCLNPITCDIYKCTAGGDAANAKWVWAMNNRGPQGPAGPKGDPTTVDAVLSKDSVNPIQNKAVATKFQDVQDSLDKLAYNHDSRVQIKWVDPGKDPEHPSGLYAIIDGSMWCDIYLGR